MTTKTIEPEPFERERHLLAAVVEYSDDAIITKTLEGIILSWNAAAERIYGYSAEEVVGQPISMLAPPDQPDEVTGILERIKRGEHVDHYETVRMRKDGRQVAVSLTISPIKDPSGHVIAASTIARDITKRKQVEKALWSRTRQLDERVKELRCLHSISEVTEKQDLSLSQTLQETINLIPPAWRFPEIACARLTLNGQIFKTNSFRETVWRQTSDIVVHGQPVGVLEVCYLAEKPEDDEGPFLKEERSLLNTIAVQLGKTLERKQAEEALRQAHDELEQRVEARTREIERRRQVAESLRDILAILNSSRPLGEILDYIVAQASWLLESDASAIYRLQDQERLLYLQAARGLDADFTNTISIPVGGGITGQAVRQGRPVAISHTTRSWASEMSDDDPVLEPEQQDFLAHMAKRYGAMLAVPLIVKDRIDGTISLYYHEPREFSGEEIELAAAFADQAALAIENARLRAQSEQVAVAAERNRLARELHDAVSQTLFSASLIAEMLPRVWQRHPEEAQASLEELRLLTQGALAEMRTLLLELRPATLTEAKLDKVLRHLTEAITSRTRVPIELVADGDCSLPPEMQIALYRITQEALNNIAKHARASQAVVELRCQSDRVELCISDDGQGFEPSSISPEHLGVGIMRERAKAIGAELEIESQLGGGTQLMVTWQNTRQGA
ncbi:MAG: PAS domain S-box protein [Anaerolineae bacterium]|nr:PAS domain S-box protein [Anaerolineae bacterium]